MAINHLARMKKSIRRQTNEELVATYTEAAAAHRIGTQTGDYKFTNKAADRIRDVYRELRERDRRDVLLALLDSPNTGVRVWAGAHALEIDPSRGEPILSVLTEEKGLLGFEASMTLKVWREGNLRFP